MPLPRKLEMFLDLFIEPMVGDEHSTREVELARRTGIDTEVLTRQAAEVVDAGRKGKQTTPNTSLPINQDEPRKAASAGNKPPEEAAA